MRSLLKHPRAIRDLLAQRGVEAAAEAARNPSRRLLARWGRAGLAQLSRRYRAARASAPGDVLERKWNTLDSS